MHPAARLLLLLLALLPALLPAPAEARTRRADAADPAALCEAAARQAAAESGVPYDILAAVSLTETGRRRDGAVRPWAWSVNAEGAGTWFDDPREALDLAEARVGAGRTNVDIGCFQINYRWHGGAFESVARMFDPLTNARYAARFIASLHAETGDWRAAAGAFHSRNPANASRYLARFDDLRALVRRGGGGDAPETYNRFAAVVRAGDGGMDRPADLLMGSGAEAPPLVLAGETAYDPAPDPRGPIDIALDSGGMPGDMLGDITGDMTGDMTGDPAPWDLAADPSQAAPDEPFAAGESPRRRRIRRDLTLLGAAPGSESAAAMGSLSPLGAPARPLLGAPAGPTLLLRTASAGPLVLAR